jgi:two-component sensor histidine kinase
LKNTTVIKLVIGLNFILALILVNTIQAQNNSYSIKKRLYSYAEGLPSRTVNCGVQDKNGFLWFGTKNGLCRFDGKKFQVFNQKTHGLRGTEISELYFDNIGGILIIYNQKNAKNNDTLMHIDVVDINTLKVASFSSYYPGAPFKEEQINSVKNSFNGDGIYFYPNRFYEVFFLPNHSIKSWLLNKKLDFVKKENYIIKTGKFKTEDKTQNLFIAPYSKTISPTKQSLLIFNDSTIVLYPDHWAYFVYRNTNGYTVCKDDSIGKKLYYQVNFDGAYKKLDSLTNNNYPFLYPGNFIYNQHLFSESAFKINENGILKIFNSNENFEITDKKIMRSTVISAFKDRLDNYWFCTTEGIIKVNLKKVKFKKDFIQGQFKSSENLSTRGIYASKEILLGALFDFFAIKNKGNIETLKLKENFAIKKIKDELWIGSFRLHKYNLVTKTIEYKVESNNQEIWSIEELNEHQLLLGCTTGLSVFDKSTNEITKVKLNNFTSPMLVYRITKTNKNQLLAIASNGVYVINNKGEIVMCYLDVIKGKLPFEAINDLYIDKDSLFWIASANEGLFCWNKKKNIFKQFGSENGFLSNTLYRIEEDIYNKLWISTDFGLAEFNKLTQKVKIYSEADGITHNEFNRASSFKADDGKIYFGGLNGITSFNPNDFIIEDLQKNYPFVIDKLSHYNFKTNNEEDKTFELKKTGYLILSGNNNITVEPKLLDFEEEEHLFAYQIEGYGTTWNYQNEGPIKISNLPYGDYILHIKAQNIDGSWNKNQINFSIKVIKPFYITWWFIFGSSITLLTLIALIIKHRTRIIKRQNDKLEKTVQYRTAELKLSLSEQIALMQEVHHRVKNNLQSVGAIIQMQIRSTKNESNKAVLKDTYRRINSMTMVHEMLLNKDKIEHIDVNVYINEIIVKLNELFLDLTTPIKFKLDIEPVKFNVNNCVALGMITSEIISNAIKHAFKEIEFPEINITLNYVNEEKMIYYCIWDNGVGINQEQKSLGIGMRLLDIFSRQLEGTYELKNEKGIRYTFKIPFIKNE